MARLKTEAEAAQQAALGELCTEDERRLSKALADQACTHDKLTAATAYTTELEKTLEVRTFSTMSCSFSRPRPCNSTVKSVECWRWHGTPPS